VELLGSAQPFVRAAAARGLARRNSVEDFDVLLQAYERARADSVRDAAVAIVDALGRVKNAGAPVDRSFFLRFPEPPEDAALFRSIRERIGEPPAHWQPPVRAPLPPRAFYVDLVQRLVAPTLAGNAQPRVLIATSHGDIELTLASAEAPLAVHNFLTLIERGYYVNTRWHRVVPNFVIQDGDARGDGSGGPGHSIRDEISPLRYERGTLGMARSSNPDTGGSQFFITHSPQPHLDGGYTVFGRVSAGMDVVDRVVQEDPILSFRIVP
jgi:cyclophilin family peptidyl-prolyl cis-trans isomerase